MRTPPLVTIALPAFRSAALIPPSLESALDQKYDRLRIVILDNRSDDDTVAVAEKISRRHPRGAIVQIVRADSHVSRIANWNRCLDLFEAQGDDYLKFLFAGDSLHPDCVGALVETAAATGAVLATSAYDIHDGDQVARSAHWDSDQVLTGRDALVASIRKGNWFGAPSALMIARTSLNGLRFSEDFDWSGDWKFCLDLCTHGPSLWMAARLAVVNLKARRFYQEQATRFASRIEDAWMRHYALRLLGRLDAGAAGHAALGDELERSLRETLLNRHELWDIAAAKMTRRLQSIMD